MSTILFAGSSLGNALQTILMADDIIPGATPSYALCKDIFLYHPLGAKLAQAPIAMAQCQQREIAIPKGPEERVREQFLKEWEAINADRYIFNTMQLSRVYGIASIALVAEGVPSNRPIDYKALPNLKIGFNVLDPLNTSGSLVLNQDPNSLDFLKYSNISVQGQTYHRSRAVVVMNGEPIFLGYTTSSFGYVGRSVYQTILYPLKSFVQTMVTDDMVSRKAGVLIAKLKPAGSIVNNIMATMAGVKRALLKEARTDNVISVTPEEDIETLNMQNIDGAYGQARKNILENIAAGADSMPAKLLNQETFAEGFGEGTEDAKYIARYIDRVRVQMQPIYAYFDKIVQYRAWTPAFFETLPEDYRKAVGGYTQAFYDWTNSFEAKWPSLLTEPDSEKIKVDDVKLKAVIAMLEVLLPMMDPENKATLVSWAEDNFNELKLMFGSPLVLDIEALKNFTPPEQEMLDEPKPARPFADGQRPAKLAYEDAVEILTRVGAGRNRNDARTGKQRAAAAS